MSTSAEEIREAERLFDLDRVVEQVPYDPDDSSGEWMKHAECRRYHDPELFHPISDLTEEMTGQIAMAASVCGGCPVIDWCRQMRYEIGGTGVWAGVYYPTPTAGGGRRPCALAGCSKPVRAATAHYCGFEHEHQVKVGTTQGFSVHRRAGTPPCKACSEAQAAAHARARGEDPREGAHGARRSRMAHTGARVAS